MLIAAVLITIALAVGTIWFAGVNRLFNRATLQAVDPTGDTPVSAATLEAPPSSEFPTLAPLILPLVAESTGFPTLANFSITHVYAAPSLPTPTPISTAPGVCGHQLEEAFGPGNRLIIHQVKYGDSLNMYDITYRTSLAAIQGVNYPFPIPLRTKWILVIPLDTKEVGDLPLFKPMLVSNRNTAIQTMAFKVSTDLLAFEKYNGFDESCRDFMGWVLAAHERPAN